MNMSRNVISDNKICFNYCLHDKHLFKKRIESMLLSTFFEEVDSFINLYQIISKLKSSVTRE